MLVLTRRSGESIFFILEDGREIQMLILEQKQGQCRIGISAPQTIKILREEVKIRSLQNELSELRDFKDSITFKESVHQQLKC